MIVEFGEEENVKEIVKKERRVKNEMGASIDEDLTMRERRK